jgi:putative holliday junction resolvase
MEESFQLDFEATFSIRLTPPVVGQTICSMTESFPTEQPPTVSSPTGSLQEILPASVRPAAELPTRGALLGLDFGTKRLGVAVCNVEQTISVPVETWTVRSPQQNLKHIRELIEDYRAVGFVVGLPVRLSGAEGDQAAVVRLFGDWLAEQTRLPVVYWDERYSSTQAEVLLWTQGISPASAKERLDRLAAQIILQAFIDAPNRASPPQPLNE